MGNNKDNNLMDKEDFISMILGLLIVGVVILVLVNYFKSKSGRIDLDGVTDTKISEETAEVENKKEVLSESVVGDEYVVAAGDSLWKIASKKYNDGFKWVEIAKANGIENEDSGDLMVGQKLKIPSLAKAELPTEHIVKSGESLSKISLNYYGDIFAWEKIWNANKNLIKEPNLIQVGLKLTIPR